MCVALYSLLNAPVCRLLIDPLRSELPIRDRNQEQVCNQVVKCQRFIPLQINEARERRRGDALQSGLKKACFVHTDCQKGRKF